MSTPAGPFVARLVIAAPAVPRDDNLLIIPASSLTTPAVEGLVRPGPYLNARMKITNIRADVPWYLRLVRMQGTGSGRSDERPFSSPLQGSIADNTSKSWGLRPRLFHITPSGFKTRYALLPFHVQGVFVDFSRREPLIERPLVRL